MNTDNKAWKQHIPLGLILALATFLRFYKLDFQSPWLDELHTLIEADPDATWRSLWDYLACCDQHPPLFFFIEKLVMTAFGHTPVVARSVSALAGIAGVWMMYSLGKELSDKRTGLIAALITAVNAYHIGYSQEARPYAFLFLFAGLSTLMLVRFIHRNGRRDAILYGITALAMITSHYFGLFTLVAQAVIFLVCMAWKQEDLKKRIMPSLIVVLITVGGFLPCLPLLSNVSSIRSFWITAPEPGFAVNYFYGFFGSEMLFKPFLLLFLVGYFISLIRDKNVDDTTRMQPLAFGFILCSCWIFVSLLIPFLRSLVVVPMLHSRYAVSVLPAFLFIVSAGITAFTHTYVRNILLIMFMIVSITDMQLIARYYQVPSKTQFREMSHIISEDDPQTTVFSASNTAWLHQYYFKTLKIKSPVVALSLGNIPDTVLADVQRFPVFRVIGVHGQQPHAAFSRLDSHYVLIDRKEFYDSWIRLYALKNYKGTGPVLKTTEEITTSGLFSLNGKNVVAVWDNEVKLSLPNLAKGRYAISVIASGTAVHGIFPILNIKAGDRDSTLFTAGEYQTKSPDFILSQNADGEASIQVKLTNDEVDPATGNDRNGFIHAVLIKRID